uniref:Uncharacterized protein n=1 Tax=Oryza barthii TaxID=65489 RepID=A0A0D3FUP5_9ORYZ
MSSIFFHDLLSKTDILLSNDVLRQETNTAALSVENEAKQLYITICDCSQDCKDGPTGEELTEHIIWCKVCKNIFKMTGTLPRWVSNGIKVLFRALAHGTLFRAPHVKPSVRKNRVRLPTFVPCRLDLFESG